MPFADYIIIIRNELTCKFNNTLFVQYHEQEIPEVIPIEGIPFVNQSKLNQINLTQHKSNQIKFWFLRRGENRSTRRKTSRSRVENQQTQPTYDSTNLANSRAVRQQISSNFIVFLKSEYDVNSSYMHQSFSLVFEVFNLLDRIKCRHL